MPACGSAPRRGLRAVPARWQGRVCPRPPTRAPITAPFLDNDQSVGVLVQSRGHALFFVCLFLVLDRRDYRVTACVHRRNTGRTRPRFVARLARSDDPQSRGPCPRADPPSPRPLRSASEVARSGLVPCEIASKGVVFFFPYRTAIRSGLTNSGTGRNTYVPAVLDHAPCMVGCVCPVESRMTKRVVFYCLTTTNRNIVINSFI